MQEHAVEIITKIAHHNLKNRQQVPEIVGWINQNKSRFNELISSFDKVVTTINTTSVDGIPPDFINAIKLKNALGSRNLPTINEMSGSDKPIKFFGISKHVNQMMSQGETTKVEPWLAFHTKKIDMESLAVGAIIHTAEEYYLSHAELSPDVHRGMIEFAVEEMSSLDENSSIWKTVSSVDKLNWIDGGEEFSPQFRTRNNLS